MKNTLFDPAALDVLLSPEAWRIVSSLFDPETDGISNRPHAAWMASHVDRHPAREILIALQGQGLYGFKGQVYPCQPGSVFLFDAFEPHDNNYAPNCPRMRHIWVRILENDVLVRILDVNHGRIAQTGKWSGLLSGTEAAALLIASWNELAAAPRIPDRLKKAKLVAALAALVAHLAGEGYNNLPKPSEQDFTAAVVQTIQRHVAQHAGRDIPLSEAARLAGYSKFHFFRLFKQHAGQTYHAYVNACRVKKAKALLHEGRRKKEISEALGFSHPSAFLRWMKAAR